MRNGCCCAQKRREERSDNRERVKEEGKSRRWRLSMFSVQCRDSGGSILASQNKLLFCVPRRGVRNFSLQCSSVASSARLRRAELPKTLHYRCSFSSQKTRPPGIRDCLQCDCAENLNVDSRNDTRNPRQHLRLAPACGPLLLSDHAHG